MFVLLALLIIALVLAGVIISLYNQKFQLFHYCLAVTAICYIAFSFLKPDYFIAKYLIDQTQLLQREDIIYLTQELSLDAAPAVLPLLTDEKRWSVESTSDEDQYDRDQGITRELQSSEVIIGYAAKVNKARPDYDIRDFNYSKFKAYQAKSKYSYFYNNISK
jgi:hypothetical protein